MPVFTFGDTRYIDPSITAIAIITTILFLALCDYVTHCIEKILNTSPVYMSMLQKIYKELMIMGKLIGKGRGEPSLSFHFFSFLFSCRDCEF